MKNRLIALLVIAALCLCLFAACGGDDSAPITEKTAISIALEDAGLSESQAEDLHAHVATGADTPSYSIHFLHGEVQYEYVIDARTGDILSSTGVE